MPRNDIPVVAIDGPTASGKGTVAQEVARTLGFHYLDSGALYRLTALSALRTNVPLTDEHALAKLAQDLPCAFHGERVLLANDDVSHAIRAEEIGNAASKIASLPAVRQALFGLQRRFHATPGLVADGRDMGTVVFPDAPLKIFLTASAEERARRRYLQLKAKGDDVSLSSLLDEICARDERDTQRAVAPLKPAHDAIQLDSTELSIEQVLERILSEIALRDLAG